MSNLFEYVLAIDKNCEQTEEWGKHGPYYYSAHTRIGEVVLSKVSNGYIWSLVYKSSSTVSSVLVSSKVTAEDIARVQTIVGTQRQTKARSETQLPAKESANQLRQIKTQTPTSINFNLEAADSSRRDPNAPPGFEDEYEILSGRSRAGASSGTGPGPFGPGGLGPYGDEDRLPPGGLKPFGSGNPMLAPIQGGAHPLDPNHGPRPIIRRDPPFPGAPEESSFNDPFGGNFDGYGPGRGQGGFGKGQGGGFGGGFGGSGGFI